MRFARIQVYQDRPTDNNEWTMLVYTIKYGIRFCMISSYKTKVIFYEQKFFILISLKTISVLNAIVFDNITIISKYYKKRFNDRFEFSNIHLKFIRQRYRQNFLEHISFCSPNICSEGKTF